MSKMTPRQQAAYALDWDLDPADLKPEVQTEYLLLQQERLINPAAGRPVPSAPPGGLPERKVYRTPLWLRLLICLPLSVAPVIGTMFLFPQEDGYRPNAFGVSLATAIIIFFLYFIAVVATNKLIVTSEGLVSWRFLRRRSIDWPSVASFEIAHSRIPMSRGDAVFICLASERIETSVEGTRRFMTRVVEELRDFQRRAGQPTG